MDDDRPSRSGGGGGGDYVFPAAPDNAASLSPEEARALFRQGSYRGSTAGFCSGYLQAGLTVLPGSLAGQFAEFCSRNHAAMPVLHRGSPGEITTPLADTNTDIRSALRESGHLKSMSGIL